jgi:nucleoside-diphosphate-sugar epimerase
MTRILLTGGSGTVGRKVLELLNLQPSFEVTAFDLNNSVTRRFYNRAAGKAMVVFGDIANPREVASVCNNKDFVIHLAAVIPPEADKKPETARKVNVEGTKNLIDALEKYSANAFLLYTSSVSVYGDRLENPDIFSTDPLAPSEGDAYGHSKTEAEQLIRNSSLSWCIVRLSAIMGAGNHKISGLMFHMPLNTPVEITTPSDTAKALVNALKVKEDLAGKIFNLGGGKNCRILYQDLLEKSFQLYGLGAMNFPRGSFAEKNFHCGYYADGDELDHLLHFRHDTIDSYFKGVGDSVSPLKKMAATAFRKIIKKQLLCQSDPWKAFNSGDIKRMQHWFRM